MRDRKPDKYRITTFPPPNNKCRTFLSNAMLAIGGRTSGKDDFVPTPFSKLSPQKKRLHVFQNGMEP
jgi:hypothetical protein